MSKIKDMRMTTEEKMENSSIVWNPSDYPGGLCISFDNAVLEKLNVDHEDWQIGDLFDLRAMARVTSISENETEAGKYCRVELQIIMLGCENESTEKDEEKSVKRPRIRYKR